MERSAQRIASTEIDFKRHSLLKSIAKPQNRLPDSLAELRPRSEIRTDPFDNEEIRYRIGRRGICNYSVGPDCIDDGGKKQIPRTAKIRFDRRATSFLQWRENQKLKTLETSNVLKDRNTPLIRPDCILSLFGASAHGLQF